MAGHLSDSYFITVVPIVYGGDLNITPCWLNGCKGHVECVDVIQI